MSREIVTPRRAQKSRAFRRYDALCLLADGRTIGGDRDSVIRVMSASPPKAKRNDVSGDRGSPRTTNARSS